MPAYVAVYTLLRRDCCMAFCAVEYVRLSLIACGGTVVLPLKASIKNCSRRHFSSPGRSPGRAIVLPPASAAASALAKSLTLKFFYVIGKALSGELSCPCDRSCIFFFFTFIFRRK